MMLTVLTNTMNQSNNNAVRVLVVDDETQFRTGLVKWLERNGCEVAEAADAPAALELLRVREFDAVLADLHMPGNMNLEFISEVPKVVQGLPVILMTGLPTVETAARSVRLPVYAYLVKPPVLSELLTIVQQAAQSSRQMRTVRTTRQRLQNLAAELEQIESGLGKGAEAGGETPMSSFLRLTLFNIATSIVELERTAPMMNQNEEATQSIKGLELLMALRHTVEVLEKTKQNFKSKDLGQLRHQLNTLLQMHELKG